MAPTPAETDILDEETAPGAGEMAAEALSTARAMDYVVTPGWFLVDTTLVFPTSVSPRKARQQVLQTARGAGLEQALPQKVSFTSLLSDIMDETAGAAFEKSTWSTFALSSVTGHLVDEKILSTDLQQLEGGAYRYRIVLEARVVPVKGERDPSLRLELEVNERLLKAGDELVIRARTSTDGYLYVFNFLSDNSVMLMFPSAAMPDNAVSAGEWLEIPTRQERSRGLHYRVAADPEHRGKGLGLAVCAQATARFIQAGYRNIYLLTDDFRLPAIKTYLKLGYEPLLFCEGMAERWESVYRQLGLELPKRGFVRSTATERELE